MDLSIFKSEYFNFMKNYLIFLILFSICFYALLYINSTSKNGVIINETNVFYYLLLIFLFIVINDIMSTPQEGLIKFVLLILFSLLIIYISSNLINTYFDKDTFLTRLSKVLISCLIVFIIFMIIIYFEFYKINKTISNNLFSNFNIGYNKNYIFLIFFTIYIYIFKYIEHIANWNTTLSDIVSPIILGSFLLFFIFCIIVFLAIKLKIIDNKQYLNDFIVFLSIATFLGFIQVYIFMTSLNGICDPGQNNQNNNDTTSTDSYISKSTIINLMIISLIIILWLDDSRSWYQMGSILFIFATIIALMSMFYYATIYPSTSLLSFWLFIEWIIIIFRKRENSKNSLHYTFMKT
jgi:hypothetical protein